VCLVAAASLSSVRRMVKLCLHFILLFLGKTASATKKVASCCSTICSLRVKMWEVLLFSWDHAHEQLVWSPNRGLEVTK
jgi:hypothetical protein